jgi:hypothetical protein
LLGQRLPHDVRASRLHLRIVRLKLALSNSRFKQGDVSSTANELRGSYLSLQALRASIPYAAIN